MKTIVEHLTQAFPTFSTELKNAIIEDGKLFHLKEGHELMTIGGESKIIPLITEGSIKVMREDTEGNEIFLYYLRPSQTCALSLNCFMMTKPSEVHAMADEESTIIALPGEKVSEWIGKYQDWREFIMGTYQMRFKEMLETIDGIAFLKLDERLIKLLTEKSEVINSKTIEVTHQELAADLNSSREVISRLLKILEKQGTIHLGRNKVTLL